MCRDLRGFYEGLEFRVWLEVTGPYSCTHIFAMMMTMMMVTSAIATTMITSFKLNGAATLQSRKLPPQSCLKALGSDFRLLSFFLGGGGGGRGEMPRSIGICI